MYNIYLYAIMHNLFVSENNTNKSQNNNSQLLIDSMYKQENTNVKI